MGAERREKTGCDTRILPNTERAARYHRVFARRVPLQLLYRERPNGNTYVSGLDILNYGGEGGILAQSLRPSCHLFSNMHEKRLNTGDFSDFYYFNSTKIFSCLVLIFALNRHQRHQGSDRASRTLIRTL
jgi:hypothetical protein